MGLSDRDYMSRDHQWLARVQRKRWWRRFRWLPAIGVATALLGLGSAAIWFLRDATNLPRFFRRAEVAELAPLLTVEGETRRAAR